MKYPAILLALCLYRVPALMGQNIVTTMAGDAFKTCGGVGDGTAAVTAQLCGAEAPTVDAAGNIYFYDYGYARIRVITPGGIINTIAGNGTHGTSGDGGPALSAQLGANLSQIAVDAAGQHLCFGDNDAHKIRCVVISTGIMQGYGTGVTAYGGAGDGGNVANASFNDLAGAVFDGTGNFYISDLTDERVRKVDMVTGIITTFAGPGPGYCCAPLGDGGPAVGANLYEPWGLAYHSGTLYIADEGNDRFRSVNLSTGVINTVAGNGSPYDSGDGGPATSAGLSPRWLALDTAGNLFITIASSVRMVDTNGIITSIAGQGGIDGIGDDYIPALQTVFVQIYGLGWDLVAKRLLMPDNGRIRQIFFTPATSTTLTPSENPARWNDTVSLQASVSPSDATGSMRFYWSSPYSASQGLWTFLGSSPIANGMATGSWTAPVGDSSYALRAVYAGDFTHNLSQSPTVAEVVQSGRSTTMLASSANPSVQGQSVTLTATIAPIGVTGTVTFQSNGVTLGTSNVNSPTAVLTTSSLPAGSNSITASYSGDSRYLASTSPILIQVVKTATTTRLTSSPNPSTVGSAVTLKATVTPSSATGPVQFFNGSTLLGSANLSSGQAQLVVTSLPPGTDSLTATYGGDSSNAGSTSAVVSQVVTVKATTATALSSTPNPSIFGATVTLTATVTPAAATGSVQFFNGSTGLGSANLTGGHAQLKVANLPAGADALTAVYGGDANNASSTSGIVTETVNKANSTTTLSASPNGQSNSGQAVTFTAKVAPSAATGVVQFLDGSAVLGSETLSSGTAVFSTNGLATGNHSITAHYAGDTNTNPSQSSALSYKVKH